VPGLSTVVAETLRRLFVIDGENPHGQDDRIDAYRAVLRDMTQIPTLEATLTRRISHYVLTGLRSLDLHVERT
jgi:hypothetical protein